MRTLLNHPGRRRAEIAFTAPSRSALREVADNLTEIDRREVFDLTGVAPRSALEAAAAESAEVFIVELDYAPVAAFGVTRPSLLGGRAVPWFLFTEAARQAYTPASLWMGARPVVDDWLSRCAMLENHVHPENARAIRWVKWLGFTVEEPAPAGPFGRLYRRFWRVQTCVQ